MSPHLPECCIARLIQTHGISYWVQKVVSLGVEEVPAGHLCALVPASEGGSGELEAPTLQHHAAHSCNVNKSCKRTFQSQKRPLRDCDTFNFAMVCFQLYSELN